MPLTRAAKEELVDEYAGSAAEAPHVFVMAYQGISVPKVTELRAKVRETGGHYQVVKNRLMRRAIEGKGLGESADAFTGPTAVVYSDGDAVALAKVLTDFAKDAPMLEFKAGVVEGKTVPAEQISAIANLPSREELIAKLLFLLQSPVTRLVRGLGAMPRRFVVLMDQIAKAKG